MTVLSTTVILQVSCDGVHSKIMCIKNTAIARYINY